MKRALLLALLLPLPKPAAMPPPRLPAARHADAVGTVELQRLPRRVVEAKDAQPDAPMPTPDNLPVPIEAVRNNINEPIVSSDVVYSPPVTMQSFRALDDDNSALPPDTNGAAGPAHIVTVLNTAIRIQDRSGGVQQTVSIKSFFDSVRKLGRVFDPHIVFDARANQWLICAITDQATSLTAQRTGSALLLGISRTNNPMLGWDLYRFDGPEGDVWLDYPGLGYDEGSIVIAANLYALSDSKFVRATVFVINRGDPAGVYTRLDHAAESGGSLSPTISLDPGGNRTFLVQMWNGNFQNKGYLRLYSVATAGIVPIAFAQAAVPWSNMGSMEDFAPQLGRAEKIDAGDSRIASAVLRNGNIWAAHTVFLPAGTPSRSAVNWWRLAANGNLVARGTIDDPSSTFSYARPGIAVNRNDAALIGCSRFSAITLPSAVYAFAGVGAGTPVVFKDGESSYVKTGNGTKNRWGDYSAACVDPINDLDFWTIQEYASTPSGSYDRWGTWWARVAAPAIQSAPSRRRPVKH
jgi:hypothetical protein